MSEKKGRFGMHGGQYIPETLMNAVQELDAAYEHYKHDPGFQAELTALLNDYAGRPSRLYYAGKVTEDLGGAKVYLKREDLNHTGAHKINNVLGQALLAKRMGKTRLIAETGAGQHGVATATAAALMGMECVVFMGEEDTKRQALNVYRMRLLGAEVVPVTSGTDTLKDACSAAFREWTNRISDTHYCIGSVMGPHPFPTMVRDFQAVISKEIKEQLLEKEGKLPDAVIACVGGGSNAIGAFYHFINDPSVRLIGCEAAGRGVDTAETAATIATGRPGIFHGMKSYFCQDQFGQIAPVYSISAGLDYPGIGPPVLEVEGLASRDGRVKQGNLTVHSGEILGVFGLGGSGRTELLECFGCRAAACGTVKLEGSPLSPLTPENAIRRGMVLISEDRRGKAMIGNLSVRDNILLSSLDSFSHMGVLRRHRAAQAAAEQIGALHIKLAGPEQRMAELSGGNQQKAVFARALMTAPKVLLCDEPTQAVDVSTRTEIHRLLRDKTDGGAGVLYVSSDLPELLETADRILIVSCGRTEECLENQALTAQQVLARCYEYQEKEARP